MKKGETHGYAQKSWAGRAMLALMECANYPMVGNASLLLCTAQEDGFLVPEKVSMCEEQAQVAVILGGEAASC